MNELHGLVVFSASLVQQLNSEQGRLPSNHVGVRRVRASNQVVWNAFRSGGNFASHIIDETPQESGANSPSIPPVTFKVIDSSGVERRMTRQEKKELKHKMQQEWKRAKKKRKGQSSRSLTPIPVEPGPNTPEENSLFSPLWNTDQPQQFEDEIVQKQKREYHRLELSRSAVEEELAELRGERGVAPPAMMTPPMVPHVRSFLCHLSKAGTPLQIPTSIAIHAELDDDLATRWASELKLNMKDAEDARCREDMRPMAYQLIPESWMRMRPAFSVADKRGFQTKATPENDAATPQCDSFAVMTIRDLVEPFDSDMSIVYDFLYQRSSLHVSCGAKFGCDFLLYDGKREERHAFAGLRVCSMEEVMGATEKCFPLPTAYDLAGFVRCLNTAGKLALLALVDRDRKGDGQISVRVAFVDLALEKILSAPTHLKRSNKKARRDVGKNLAKYNPTT